MLFVDSAEDTFFSAEGANQREDVHLFSLSLTARRSNSNGSTPSGTICPDAVASITKGEPQNWHMLAVSFVSVFAAQRWQVKTYWPMLPTGLRGRAARSANATSRISRTPAMIS